MDNYLIVFAVIIVIIAAYILYCSKSIPSGQLKEHMNGYWVADKEFLDQTEYSHIGLYLKNEKEENIGQLVVAYDDDTYLINGPINYNYSITNSPAVWMSLNNEYELNVNIDGANPFIPDDENINIKLSPYDGSMIIYKDSTIYAILYKDNIASSAAKIEAESMDNSMH